MDTIDDYIKKLEAEMAKYRELTAALVAEQCKVNALNLQLEEEQRKIKQLQKDLAAAELFLLKEKTRNGREAVREWWETNPENWKDMWQRDSSPTIPGLPPARYVFFPSTER